MMGDMFEIKVVNGWILAPCWATFNLENSPQKQNSKASAHQEIVYFQLPAKKFRF